MRPAPRNHKTNLRNTGGKIAFSPGLAPTHELSEEFPKSRRCSDFFANMPACRTPMDEEGDYCPPMPREEPDGSPCPGLSKSVPNLAAEEKREAAMEQEAGYQPPSYIYLDPDKKMKVTDNTLKLIQKQAVLDYYERQKKSDPSKDESISKPASPESQNVGRKFARSVSQGSLALSVEGKVEGKVEGTSRLEERIEARLGLESSSKEGSSQASLASSCQHQTGQKQEYETQVSEWALVFLWDFRPAIPPHGIIYVYTPNTTEAVWI